MTPTTKTIMLISGSPRKNGTSACLLQCFTDSLTRGTVGHSLSFVPYNAFNCGFAPCTDCRACRRLEKCVNPDMDAFFADFEAADGIVIATPIYNLSFPAPLKAILDRMQRYYNARFYLGKRPPIARYRPVALLMSAGSSDEDGAVAVKQLERIFTVTHCTLVSHCIANGTDRMSGENSLSDDVVDAVHECATVFMKNV